MIAFEDLRNQQFKSMNSVDGLDTNHMKLTLLTLAKWHAGTASLLHTVLFTDDNRGIIQTCYVPLFRILSSLNGIKNEMCIKTHSRCIASFKTLPKLYRKL